MCFLFQVEMLQVEVLLQQIHHHQIPLIDLLLAKDYSPLHHHRLLMLLLKKLNLNLDYHYRNHYRADSD